MTTPPAEYTPTTDEIRNRYAAGRRALDPQDTRSVPPSALDSEFDRYLAAHDATTIRQAKAEALREAAAEVYPRAAFWLRARASRIEAGE